jgi:Cu/Ag efflux protein CusF
MKALLAVAVCSAWFVVSSPVAIAAERPPEAAEEASPSKPKRKSYKGTIEALDAASRTITIKKVHSSKTFTVAPNAHIKTVDKQHATLADLKKGDIVNVRFTVEGDVNVASRVAHADEMKRGESDEDADDT